MGAALDGGGSSSSTSSCFALSTSSTVVIPAITLRVVAQRVQAVVHRRALDRLRVGVLQDEAAHIVVDDHQLVDPAPTYEAFARAFIAAARFVEHRRIRHLGAGMQVGSAIGQIARRELSPFFPAQRACIDPELDELVFGGRVGLAAVGTQNAHQALGEDPDDAGAHQEWLHAHVDQAGDSARRVVGVNGGQHQVTGERCLDRDLRRLFVADLADHDDVGILAQESAQRAGEGQPDPWFDVQLVDPAELVLHGIFGGEDVAGGLVDAVEACVQRRCLAATGWAGHQDDAVGSPDEPIHDGVFALLEAEVVEAEQHRGLLQQAHHDALEAAAGGNGRYAHVDALASDLQRDTAVLRQSFLGNVELRHDLHARQNRRHELL